MVGRVRIRWAHENEALATGNWARHRLNGASQGIEAVIHEFTVEVIGFNISQDDHNILCLNRIDQVFR